jgi:hypothetical protein
VIRRAAWAAILAGMIVGTPLDELGAHPLVSPWARKTEPIAPFDEMGSIENISIVGAAPNQDDGLNTCRIVCPINEYRGRRYIEKRTGFDGVGSQEKWGWFL